MGGTRSAAKRYAQSGLRHGAHALCCVFGSGVVLTTSSRRTADAILQAGDLKTAEATHYADEAHKSYAKVTERKIILLSGHFVVLALSIPANVLYMYFAAQHAVLVLLRQLTVAKLIQAYPKLPNRNAVQYTTAKG